MERFANLRNYYASDLAALTDEELAERIRKLNEWDGDLLADLIWRAFPDYDEQWEVGDPICYEAAEKLGVRID